MNYFAHAIRHLDRPLFLAGLALPDWLSVVDRQVRVRAKSIEQQFSLLSPDASEIATGILQHLEDDRWFHGTEGFYRVTGLVAAEFRRVLGDDEQWQCGFLGHIVTELLLDAVLAERHGDLLDLYYERMLHWDTSQIQEVVNQLATRETLLLADFIGLFVKERFLFDYRDDTTLLRRLNQVMRRVQLPVMPAATTLALAAARQLVRSEVEALLPPAHFPELPGLSSRYSV